MSVEKVEVEKRVGEELAELGADRVIEKGVYPRGALMFRKRSPGHL